MTKYIARNQRPRTEEIEDLVSFYKQRRSIERNATSSSAVSSSNLNAINLSPWDYSLDQNIVIKTERDLVFDSKSFSGIDVSSDQDSHYYSSTKDYFDEMKMDSIHTGAKNSVTFSSVRNEASAYEEQYISLKAFLAACNCTYRKELSGMMFPIFVNFYLDLILKEETTAAQTFYSKFSHDHEDLHKDIIKVLSTTTSPALVELNCSVKAFKEQKSKLNLSLKVYNYLLQHLRHGNYALVLQTINQRISVHTNQEGDLVNVVNSELCQDFDDYDELSLCSQVEQNKVEALQKSITEMNNLKAINPSICLYTFQNTNQGLCSASFSDNSNLLCGGFEDSSVHLWSLTVKKLNSTRQRGSSSDSSHNDSIIMRGHSGSVYSCQFLPETEALLTSSEDSTVRLWSVQSATSLVEYKGHNNPVWDVAVAPRGAYFASASLDRSIRLWHTEYAFPLRIFAGHNDSVDCVQFHPNGNYIASGSSDFSCRLWDIQSGQFVRVFAGHKGPIYALAFTPDGKYLVSAGDDASIFVWDLANGLSLTELKGHTDTIYSLAFSQDCSMLASAGIEGGIKVWDMDHILRNGSGISSSNIMRNSSSNGLFSRATDLIGSYATKGAHCVKLKFSEGNLLLAAAVTDGK